MNAARTFRPFPFASLESLTRENVAAVSRLRRRAERHVRVEAVGPALTELVGEAVDLRLRRLDASDPTRGATNTIGVLLAASEQTAPEKRVLVEVEGALGIALVMRSLRQRAPRIIDASRAPSPALCGAVAAVIHAAVRRAHAGVAMKVISAGPGAALERDLEAHARGMVRASFTVTIGGDAFEARVCVADEPVATAASPLTRDSLLRMGDAPIVLPVVVATTLASRAELRSLEQGDAFIPARFSLRVTRNEALEGRVALVAPRGEKGLAADLAGDGRLVIRGQIESHSWSAEPAMPSESSASTTIEVLEDAPVVVRVELGSVEMTAREWAELGPGDVIALGRKIGAPATLRVGGVEVARGELVQVEGEYAVRILGR